MCQATAVPRHFRMPGQSHLAGTEGRGNRARRRKPAGPSQTAEVEIPGFTFGCTTPSGTLSSPNLGTSTKPLHPAGRTGILSTEGRCGYCNHGQLETFRGARSMNEDEAQQSPFSGCKPKKRVRPSAKAARAETHRRNPPRPIRSPMFGSYHTMIHFRDRIYPPLPQTRWLVDSFLALSALPLLVLSIEFGDLESAGRRDAITPNSTLISSYILYLRPDLTALLTSLSGVTLSLFSSARTAFQHHRGLYYVG